MALKPLALHRRDQRQAQRIGGVGQVGLRLGVEGPAAALLGGLDAHQQRPRLRPQQAAPSNPPSRAWYPYLILQEAYLNETSNRDIMLKLYISEGTFNRTRRAAIRSLARALGEMEALMPRF